MKKVLLQLVVVCSFFLTGCAWTTRSIVFDKTEFEAQKEAFESSGITSYTYTYEVPVADPPDTLTYRLSVTETSSSGTVTSTNYPEEELSLHEPYSFTSVSELYSQIESLYYQYAAELTSKNAVCSSGDWTTLDIAISYNDSLHVPESVQIHIGTYVSPLSAGAVEAGSSAYYLNMKNGTLRIR